MNDDVNPRPSVLTRLPWLLALESVLLVVCIYPLNMREAWLASWLSTWNANKESSWFYRLLDSELEPLITFHFSPLILKAAPAAACLVLFISVLMAGRFLRSFVPGSVPDWRVRREQKPAWSYTIWLVALAWFAVSAFWSPTPALSRSAIPWLLAFGLFGFALLRRGIRIDEARQLAVLLMGIGTVVGVISAIQATRPFGGAIFDFMHEFTDPRNAYGSLLGHNTAMGSFMLMTLFPALALSMQGATWQRVLAGGYVGLTLIVLVIVQSRAAWLIGPFLIAVYVVKGGGWSRRIIRRAGALLVVLLLLAIISQSVSAPWNPFYVRERPVVQRFRDLSFEQLQKEARLRLVICSIPLIAEKPLFGHGLYSFQHVYPRAQGDYFAANPDTRLGFTNKRSHMAHNEYVQTAVEQGLVGLLLLLAALFEAFRKGMKIRGKIDDPHRPLHAAFGFSALALALAAGVDFPFHIPQLVLPWMLCLAAFSSMVPHAEDAAQEADVPVEAAVSATTFRIDRVFGLTLGMLLLSLAPVANYFFLLSLSVDTKFLHASSLLSTVRERQSEIGRERTLALMERSIGDFVFVTRMLPGHGHAKFLLGEAHLTLGNILADVPDQGGRLSEVQAIQVAKAYDLAAQYVSEAMKTLRTHHTYYVLALCYRGLAGLAGEQHQEELLDAYQESLEQSVYFAPGYGPALYLLAEFLSTRPDSDPERIAELRRSIQRHDPWLFRDRYLAEAKLLLRLHRWDEAVRASESLLNVNHADTRFLEWAMRAHLHAGSEENLDRVRQIAKMVQGAAEAMPPPGAAEARLVRRARLYAALADRDWARALNSVSRFEPQDARERAWLQALLSELEARGAGVPTVDTGEPVDGLTPDEPEPNILEEMRLAVAWRLFHDEAAARQAILSRRALGGSPSPEFWTEVAAFALAMDDETLHAEALGRLGSGDVAPEVNPSVSPAD